jgi:SAM-dependent methyltransferase
MIQPIHACLLLKTSNHGGTYEWAQDGDAWSEWWGTAAAQWHGCLPPRVFPFLGGRILEIAPGHSQRTQFLQAHCTSLIGIDIAQGCVDRCTERFPVTPNLEFGINDGYTFPMIESGPIDFAFSFDSLVHAEADLMSSYARELARVLRPGAVAFIHPSNLEAVPRSSVLFRVGRAGKRTLSRLSGRLNQALSARSNSTAWRATSMCADKMGTFVKDAGMMCVQQEIIPWGPGWRWLTDCMSTIVNTPGTTGDQCQVLRNHRFMLEVSSIKRISSLRGVSSPGRR